MVSFEGIGENVVSFYNGESEKIAGGTPVKMSDNGKVAACADGDKLCGIAVDGDKEYASVQVAGFVKVKYSGTTAPSVGYTKLLADGAAGVKAADTGREYLAVEVDTTAKTVTIVL